MNFTRRLSKALLLATATFLATPALAAADTAERPQVVPANTQAVPLVFSSHQERDTVSIWGETVFGKVLDPSKYTRVEIYIPQIDHRFQADVGKRRGQFAVRLFPWMFNKARKQNQKRQITLEVQGIEPGGIRSEKQRLTVWGVRDRSGTVAALNRISFGATPELYDHVRSIGFEAYVREQLNPAGIRNAEFKRLGYRDYLSPAEVAEKNVRSRPSGSRFVPGYDSQAYIANYNLAHALYSDKQLNEVMTRFWANHFHTIRSSNKDLLYEAREWNGFRKLALTSFEELLMFSAHSPTMQSYLSNDISTKHGLNENYARELLELHTVGVDSSYGDEDIIAVARIFTGWGVTRDENSSLPDYARLYKFKFKPEYHDTDEKVVSFLGEDGNFRGISGYGGIREGRRLLSTLAQHPDTQKFVCGKLVNTLVGDGDGWARFLNKCREAWAETNGQIKPILEAILLDTNYAESGFAGRGKVRTGLEYAMAVGRAFDIRPRENQQQRVGSTFLQLAGLGGYNFLSHATPDGLPENGGDWISTATTIGKFAKVQSILTWWQGNRTVYDIRVDDTVLREQLETADEVADYLLTLMTGGRYTSAEYYAVIRVLYDGDSTFDAQDEPEKIRKALGLVALVPTAQLQ